MRSAAIITLAVLASTAGCPCQPPTLILARITVEPDVSAGCIGLEVTPSGGTEVREVAGFAREPTRSEYSVAVYRGDLPDEVGLRAFAFDGPSCDDPRGVRGRQSELVTRRFVEGQSVEAPLLIKARDIVGEPVAVAFASPPLTLYPGECSRALPLELRDRDGNVRASATPLAIAVGGTPATGFSVYIDSSCMTSINALTLPAGTATLTLYARGTVPAVVTLSASSPPLTQADLAVTLMPNVLRGLCALGDGTSSVDCPVTPPIMDPARAMLFFQATSTTNSPKDANVRCLLGDAGTITCRRVGDVGVANISWQLAQLQKGMRVQHLDVPATGPTTSIPIERVDGGSAFVLMSVSTGGSSQGQDDLVTVELASETEVRVTSPSDPAAVSGAYAIQVVELANAQVTRGVAGPLGPDAGTLTLAGLPSVAQGRTFLLYSWRTGNGGQLNFCDRVVRGELRSATELFFSRGMNDRRCMAGSIDAIAWQRVQLAAGLVQQRDATLGAGTVRTNIGINTVTTHRAFTFAGGQSASGQALGEGLISADDVIGDVSARHSLSATTLTLERDSTDAGARWTSYVVELSP